MKKILPALVFAAFLSAGCKSNTGNERLLFFINEKGKQQAVNSVRDWEKKRSQILDSMQAAMGTLPSMNALPLFDLQIKDSLQQQNYTRYTISFLVAVNERLPAYLYVPLKKDKEYKMPAMLALHETDALGKGSVDGQGNNPHLGYAKELAQRGYVVIAPDYPGFGDLKTYDFASSRYQSGTMKSIVDDIRCVDLLLSMANVDPDRIGIIGHSLGGHSALFAAAFDRRLKVAVSSCGFTLLDYYNIGKEAEKIYGGRLGPWAQDRYMPLLKKKYQLKPECIPFDFDEVIAAIAPRAVFINSPINDGNFDVQGVKKGFANISPVFHFFDADSSIQFRYPVSQHDFPDEVRQEAYRFIDKVFNHVPSLSHIQ